MVFFDTIVKRVANFSIQSYEHHKDDLIAFFNGNELFKLGVLTASNSLYTDIKKNKSEKVEGSLYNYFIRAHFNPTPFGVFNSVGSLKWDKVDEMSKAEEMRVMVKYDNLFISSKINNSIESNYLFSSYCTNPSIYFLSNEKIGFYKSENKTNDKIQISYTEIDIDEDLIWLLKQFEYGKKVDLVVEDLIQQGFEKEEVEGFMLETIEAGLIIETFLFNAYTDKLYNQYNPFNSNLISKREHLLKSTNEIEKFAKDYISEQEFLFEENAKPKDFYAINSFDTATGSLNVDIQEKVRKFIDFAVHYNSDTHPINDNLEKFINQLQSKYNEGFVPLSTVFNPYSGIRYNDIKTEHHLKLDKEILTKILSSADNNLYLNLPTDDKTAIKASKLPATFNVMLETLVCKRSGESIIYITGLGDPSALNIISRFSDVTQDACNDIISYEKKANPEKILADINCVGTFRSINVAPTSQRFDYCLPINTAYKEEANPILLSDIYVHLHNNNISLVSQKHKKQILPKKVSAINHKLLDSDLYNFLCDFEFYNQEIYSVNFNFNAYQLRLPYVPRIYLEKGILLYPAQILLVYNNFSLEKFRIYLHEKINQYSFSKKIVISEMHRVVILDIENKKNIDLLFEKLKSTKQIYVSECLYDHFNPGITRSSENFAHELVVAVKNPYYTRQNVDYSNLDISIVESQNTAVVSDWLYLDLFCNTYADSELFKTVYNKIILENKTEQFFFVNYTNPDRHLRLRFKTKSIENKQFIISLVHELKLKNIISKYHILPYEQEIHRYGGPEMMEFSETVFDLDSRDFLANVADQDFEENEQEIIAILKVKNYLNFLKVILMVSGNK
ncbi:MAG: thiopeptide-type bacteriocin biosynthesis protein [Flavobacterium sp.]